MISSDKQDVWEAIHQEGFDYAFVHYSNFDDIEDAEFHRLRKNYLEAREKLAKYIDWED